MVEKGGGGSGSKKVERAKERRRVSRPSISAREIRARTYLGKLIFRVRASLAVSS